MPVKNKIDEVNPHRFAQANGKVSKKQIEIDGKKHIVTQILDGHLLDWLLSRGQITSDHHRAGTRFYADWYHSGVSGARAIDYSAIRVDTSAVKAVAHRSLAAMTRWNAAIRALGRVHCHPLTCMVLQEMPPEEYGRVRCGQNNAKLGRLAAITLLTASLEALDDHYTK